MQTLRITQIQRFSVDDGPGIRTTAFLAGCNLRCAWCHNPEAMRPEKLLGCYAGRCIACGACGTVCPNGVHRFTEHAHILDRDKCTGCMRCVTVCPAGALEQNWHEISPEALAQELLADRGFFASSGGGVTFSGGEPMLQHEALVSVMRICREAGVSVALDTAACMPEEWFDPMLELADLFLIDCKAFSRNTHIACTGVPNEQILSNIEWIARRARVWIRIPVVPGWNDGEMESIARFLAPIPVEKIELLPYHAMGRAKYEIFGLPAPAGIVPPDKDQMNKCLQLFLDLGLPAEHRM